MDLIIAVLMYLGMITSGEQINDQMIEENIDRIQQTSKTEEFQEYYKMKEGEEAGIVQWDIYDSE